MNKIYLGDSVYAATDEEGRVRLTTENGYPDDPRNVIVFEPQVLAEFLRWVVRIGGRQ